MLTRLLILSLVFTMPCRAADRVELPPHEWPAAISPDSRMVVTMHVGPGSDTLKVRDTQRHDLVFHRAYPDARVASAGWLNDSMLIVARVDSQYVVLNIVTGHEEDLSALQGIEPQVLCIDRKAHRLLLAFAWEPGGLADTYASEVSVYHLATDSLERLSFTQDLRWLLGLAPWSGDTLLANLDGFLSLMDLGKGEIVHVLQADSTRIPIGESTPALVPGTDELLVEAEGLGIALYGLTNHRLQTIPDLAGLSYPILAPNNRFLYAISSKAPYQAVRIDDMSFLLNPEESK